MTFSRDDFLRIKGPIVALVLVLVAGIGSLFVTDKFARSMGAGKSAAVAQLADAVARLEQVQKDKQDFQTYAEQYQALIDQGVIGEDRRLDWIEAIEKVRAEERVFRVKYAMAPQKAFNPAPVPAPSNFEMKVSAVTLQLDLLHEGQLLDFLDELRAQSKGFYLLDKCAIARSGGALELRYAPQLKAECALNWLTMREKSAR